MEEAPRVLGSSAGTSEWCQRSSEPIIDAGVWIGSSDTYKFPTDHGPDAYELWEKRPTTVGQLHLFRSDKFQNGRQMIHRSEPIIDIA